MAARRCIVLQRDSRPVRFATRIGRIIRESAFLVLLGRGSLAAADGETAAAFIFQDREIGFFNMTTPTIGDVLLSIDRISSDLTTVTTALDQQMLRVANMRDRGVLCHWRRSAFDAATAMRRPR